MIARQGAECLRCCGSREPGCGVGAEGCLQEISQELCKAQGGSEKGKALNGSYTTFPPVRVCTQMTHEGPSQIPTGPQGSVLNIGPTGGEAASGL